MLDFSQVESKLTSKLHVKYVKGGLPYEIYAKYENTSVSTVFPVDKYQHQVEYTVVKFIKQDVNKAGAVMQRIPHTQLTA